MQRHQQLVLVLIKAHQGDPQQRAFLQIEGRLRLIVTDLLRPGLKLGSGQVADVDALQVEGARRIDLLQRYTVAFKKARAQGFMALDQLLDAKLSSRHGHQTA